MLSYLLSAVRWILKDWRVHYDPQLSTVPSPVTRVPLDVASDWQLLSFSTVVCHFPWLHGSAKCLDHSSHKWWSFPLAGLWLSACDCVAGFYFLAFLLVEVRWAPSVLRLISFTVIGGFSTIILHTERRECRRLLWVFSICQHRFSPAVSSLYVPLKDFLWDLISEHIQDCQGGLGVCPMGSFVTKSCQAGCASVGSCDSDSYQHECARVSVMCCIFG